MKKSTIALLSIGAVCIVAGGWYAIQSMSSTTLDQGLFATQSVRSQCINNEQEYISCRKEGFSEKFCLIKQSTNRETGKSCLSKIPAYSKPVAYTTPVEDEHEIYTDRITIMLSEKNTGRKTILTDFNNAEQSAEEYTANGLRQQTSPYETELMDYLNVALDAYNFEIDNWSSYFAENDESVNANIVNLYFANETDIGTFVDEFKSKIDKDGAILPVYKRTLYGTPNDPQANNLWHLKGGNGVHAYRAWDQLAERKLIPVSVGIIDDGFYVEHEDLNIASAVPAGAGGGHGTHIAGLVGAITNNEKGVASAARNRSNLLIMRGYNYRFGQGDNDGSSNIMGLVSQAVQDGAKVINMSRGGGGYSSADAQIFQAAYNMGVVLIAAAGNESANQPGYPARYPGVISIGATTNVGNLAHYSNKGADLLSPGSSIISTCIGGGYCNHSGTSMASPLAASVAALLLSINPSLSPDEIENILKSTTNPKGVINACNAVAQLLGNDPAVVCDENENTGGDLGDNCLGDTECQSGVCEEIVEGKCVSGKYGEKIACKGFTTEEQCLGFKQDVGGTSSGSNGNLVSVCEWEETVVGGTCVGNCGNGVLEGINGNNEQCDDGNNTNGDGCDSMCKKEGCTSDSECSEGYCNGYLSSGCYKKDKIIKPQIPEGSNTGGGTNTGGDGDGDGDGIDCQSLEKDICRTTNNCLWFDERKGTCKVPICGDSIIDPGEECELPKGNPGGGQIPPKGDIEGNGGVVGSTWECIECKKVYKDTLCEEMKNNKAAFDYNNDGMLNQSDVKILQDIILGILPLSPTLDGKTGDLNKDNKLTAADIMLYNRQLQDCLKSICGNGTKEGTEQCDDGNQNNGDGCSNICEIEKKELPTCGNNIIEAPEQCDGSGCAKGQTCAAAGSKNACTCQTEIIKEPIPTTPPTRDGGKMDR